MLPILLVEDDVSLAHTLASAIEAAGIRVEHSATGESAIDLLQTRDFAVAIIDIVLSGGLSGVYVANAIRRIPAKRRPRVIIVTGANVDTIRGLERSVVGAILLKPLHFALFTEYVLATYRVAIADRASQAPPVQTFCGACQSPLLPWMPERLPVRGSAVEMAAFERWVDTPCTNCGASPRLAGGYSRIS